MLSSNAKTALDVSLEKQVSAARLLPEILNLLFQDSAQIIKMITGDRPILLPCI